MAQQKQQSKPKPKPASKAKIGRPRIAAPMLPIYDSMGSCAAATGIPLGLLKRAKKGGCPAFRTNRVYLADLLPWLFAQGDDAAVGNWQEMLTEFKARRERLRYERDKGNAVDRDLVRSAVQRGVSAVFGSLDRLFVNELPPALRGLDEIPIRDRCQAAIEKLKLELRKGFEAIEEIREEDNSDE